MKKTFFALIALPVLIACQNRDTSLDAVSFDSSVVTTPVRTENAAIVPSQDSVAPATTSVLPNNVQAMPVTNTSPVTVAAAGMNPAHGQPGHRCDIAVGAPLNSAPAKPATVTTTNNATITPTATATPTKTLPGINPPHGEAGHRCDIAVGAPLNSPATKTPDKAAVIPPATVTPAATVDNANTDSSKH